MIMNNEYIGKPLTPKSTSVWLIENTALSFQQIADFCQLHLLEVEALANEEIHKSLQGVSPILTGETNLDDIHKCEKDPTLSLRYNEPAEYSKYRKAQELQKQKKASVVKGYNKHDAILWTIKHHPHLDDDAIRKLFKTTKNMVSAIRNHSHPQFKNFSPKSPVTLGLCKEADLIALEKNYTVVESSTTE